MRRCTIEVRYYDGSGWCPARFWDYQDAVKWAALKAARFSVEMTNKTGIIGQWQNGKVTREFHGRDLPNATVA